MFKNEVKLVLATRNVDKIVEIKHVLSDLNIEIVSVTDFSNVPNVEEDGDTIEVKLDGQSYRVQYTGIECPEQGERLHDEATEYNRQMVGGKTVQLEKDVSETDEAGRLLRYVYFREGDEWYSVNGSLVYWGLATVSIQPPDVKHRDQFLGWQRDAQENGRGIWSGPPVE